MDAINWRGTGEQYQPWYWVRRCDHRHAGSGPGCGPSWQHVFSDRYDHFYGNNVTVVSGFDALPRLASDARQVDSANPGSLRDFLVDRWNLHTVCAGAASRVLGLDAARADLGARRFRRVDQGDTRRVPSSQARHDTLSRNGLACSYFHPAIRARSSALRAAVAARWWNRLHNRRVIFRE